MNSGNYFLVSCDFSQPLFGFGCEFKGQFVAAEMIDFVLDCIPVGVVNQDGQG